MKFNMDATMNSLTMFQTGSRLSAANRCKYWLQDSFLALLVWALLLKFRRLVSLVILSQYSSLTTHHGGFEEAFAVGLHWRMQIWDANLVWTKVFVEVNNDLNPCSRRLWIFSTLPIYWQIPFALTFGTDGETLINSYYLWNSEWFCELTGILRVLQKEHFISNCNSWTKHTNKFCILKLGQITCPKTIHCFT